MFREGTETGGLRSDINECELDQPCANGAAYVESSTKVVKSTVDPKAVKNPVDPAAVKNTVDPKVVKNEADPMADGALSGAEVPRRPL